MPYARSYGHRRRLFPRRRYAHRYSRRYSRNRRLPSDKVILAVFVIVLIIIALATR